MNVKQYSKQALVDFDYLKTRRVAEDVLILENNFNACFQCESFLSLKITWIVSLSDPNRLKRIPNALHTHTHVL